jgi:hypothetical protein
LVFIAVNRQQGRQDGACAVNVVDTSTTKPATVFLLLGTDEMQTAPHGRVLLGEA